MGVALIHGVSARKFVPLRPPRDTRLQPALRRVTREVVRAARGAGPQQLAGLSHPLPGQLATVVSVHHAFRPFRPGSIDGAWSASPEETKGYALGRPVEAGLSGPTPPPCGWWVGLKDRQQSRYAAALTMGRVAVHAIRVVRMSPDVAGRLTAAPLEAGHVHSVFERTLNLAWHDGRLLTLQGPGRLLAPFAAALTRWPHSDAVRPGIRVWRRGETLALDG